MAKKLLIPAAQYVRMSTQDQRYSIANQKAAIEAYAAKYGYAVVSTYTDSGRSGVAIQGRGGLKQLLQDVMSGDAYFKVILVYDVSRWGRFQDTDEAAHYEFLCRSGGVPVHYCAEQFSNDGTLTGSIMKALKRTMAAEYSRELGVKVAEGQRRLAGLGYRVCGTAGFGLRRMMVSADGRRRSVLEDGECKSIKSDHTILVPGPKEEVATIREIFLLASSKRNTPARIAEQLNLRSATFLPGRRWEAESVYHILKNEKYMGCNIYGKVSKKLHTRSKRMLQQDWVTNTEAFVPLISAEQFARVQRRLRERNHHVWKADEYMLKKMRRVLRREGRLSENLLKGSFDYRACSRRFGSLIKAYERIGYTPSPHAVKSLPGQLKIRQLRKVLFDHLKVLFGDTMRLVRLPGQTSRQVLQFAGGFCVAVHICRPRLGAKSKGRRWWLMAQPRERGVPALVCTTDVKLENIVGYHLMPEFNDIMARVKVLREGDSWFRAGVKLERLEDLHRIASALVNQWKDKGETIVVGDLAIQSRTCRVAFGKREICLPTVEAELFKTMILNAGSIVARSQLVDPFSGCEFPPTHLNAHISALRRRLGPQLRHRIETITCVGYRYVGPAKANKTQGAR